MKLKSNLLRDALLAAIATSATTLTGAAFAQETSSDNTATTLDRIEVTGSRVKRADIEGSLPVTVIDRATIESSGKVSVAELLQSSTFNSFGSVVPASGSSAQSFSEISLRGMGGGRTLVLIDGRRAPTSPQTGEGQDLNSIPLAAIERVEILSDGASAIYGADALAGVVNLITRKDFNGAELTIGKGQSKVGGDTEEASALFGVSNDRGRIIGGVSYNSRGITYTRDLPWVGVGASTYGNNYYNFALDPDGKPVPTSAFRIDRGDPITAALPGGCTNPGFYLVNTAGGNQQCLYDFNSISATTASIDQSGLFSRGDFQINDDWSVYFSANVTRVESFGRYAPTPEFIFVSAASPNNASGEDAMIKHRFAALGPRDNFDQTNVYDFTLGFNWQASEKVFVDFGTRRSESNFDSNGYNYVNIPRATQLFESGEYNAFDPINNDPDVLDAIRATTARNGHWKTEEFFATANVDTFEMGGGMSGLAVGAEYRREDYADVYDAQSAAGQIGGSSGNSSFGKRELNSLFAEWVFPITSQFELDLAARYDDYSDFGDSVSPKASVRFQPIDSLTLRASYGEGFRAPPLSIINQQDAFSADTVADVQTCVSLGLAAGCSVQINGLRVATPELQPEESKSWGAGIVWDATDWLNMSLDYYRIEIENQVRFYSAQTVIERTALGQFLPPQLFVTREPGTGAIIQVRAGYGNEGLIDTDGLDFVARTNFDLGEWGRLRNSLNFNYVNKYEISSQYTSDDFIKQAGYPGWRGTFGTTWEIGDFSASWLVNAIGRNEEFYEDYFAEEYGYSCAETVEIGYVNHCGGKNYFTHDVQVSYRTPWNGKISIGANNVTNRLPLFDESYTERYNATLYSPYGRQIYARYTQTF